MYTVIGCLSCLWRCCLDLLSITVCSGLSVLCGGDRDAKARAAFALYDFDSNGIISLDEMTTYLSAMFAIIFFVDPATRDATNVTPRELAVATATQAFADADLNGDGKLSLSPNDRLVSFEEMQRQYIMEALRRTKGKVTGSGGAAELLKVNGRTLMSKMVKLGIERGTFT